ncbi:hypothetical protein M5K25_026156 [Dendrobium thyrsiflorum]|uniref:Uncharacterized protein n=1 Tax=Dendrobium thyrsiflorum TaxID=117978 RepID=A0ABD0TWJ9_DENTH
MEAEEAKRTKQGMFAAAATGRKEEAMEISMMREETGGEQVEMKEGSRSAERRRASIWRKKGSEDGGKRDGSRGLMGSREGGRMGGRIGGGIRRRIWWGGQRGERLKCGGRKARRQGERMERDGPCRSSGGGGREVGYCRRRTWLQICSKDASQIQRNCRQIIAGTIATQTMQGLHTVAQLRRKTSIYYLIRALSNPNKSPVKIKQDRDHKHTACYQCYGFNSAGSLDDRFSLPQKTLDCRGCHFKLQLPRTSKNTKEERAEQNPNQNPTRSPERRDQEFKWDQRKNGFSNPFNFLTIPPSLTLLALDLSNKKTEEEGEERIKKDLYKNIVRRGNEEI